MVFLLVVLIGGFAVAAATALVRGLMAFFRDGENLNQTGKAPGEAFGVQQNRMMTQRVLFQGIAEPVAAVSHRWRYALSAGTGDGALWNRDIRLGVCGDWLLGPRVECAWLSGRMLADICIGTDPIDRKIRSIQHADVQGAVLR